MKNTAAPLKLHSYGGLTEVTTDTTDRN